MLFFIKTLIVLFIPLTVMANESSHPLIACQEFIDYGKVTTDIEPTETPFKKGLLWKVEKNGKVNHVFGTIHSQDYAVTRFSPQLRLALVKSKTLLMETIPNERSNQAFLDNMYFTDETQLNELLEPELFGELTLLINDYGIAPERVNQLKPWAAFSIIGRPRPVRAPTQEMNLMQIGLQSGLDIKELESMEEIVSSLDELSMDDQVIILKDTICNYANIIRDAKKLIDLYVARDLAGIVEFNKQPHYDEEIFERFMYQILYKRNEKVMKIIEEEFTKGKAFVAIGASHLGDEKGLLNQLQQRGYTISPVY